MLSIAIVGTGPTGLYTFAGIVAQKMACDVTLFEKGDTIGVGTPYSLETATKAMLANIASIEIPPLACDYLEWMRGLSDEALARFGIERARLDERLFTPRLMLGAYFNDQFEQLITRARAQGIKVTLCTETEVTDVVAREAGVEVVTAAGGAVPFDRVVLASGHSFPEDDALAGRYFPNPWSGLIQTEIPAVRVGVLGTSLSAIDAAMAVAGQHGRFRADGEGLVFEGAPEGLAITLMSRSGVLPEADFYCPIPYAPLDVMTPEALERALAGPAPLDAGFALFRAQITADDPDYAARVGLAQCGPDDFAPAYFAERLTRDPFGWALENLREVEENKRRRVTVAWRYAILRMHEVVEEILPHLGEEDRARFDAGLKRVFIDNYAAVPSESIRRLLALRAAGVLRVEALGQDYDLSVTPEGTRIVTEEGSLAFDVFIDARGQTAMEAEDLPFPSLRHAVIAAGQEAPEVDGGYALCDVPGYGGRMVMAALPYLMHDRPFVQGITASAEIGAAIAAGLAAQSARARRRRWADARALAA